MSQRYYSQDPLRGDRTTLTGSEAHHLLHVMRAGVGDHVTLFDGTGAEFSTEVIATTRSAVELAVLERHDTEREPAVSLTLVVALPKGERQKWLVEKLTELGATKLIPLATERGVAQPTASAVARLERTVIEACKQCGRNRLMVIGPATPWEELVESETVAHRWVAHPSGQPLRGLGSALSNQLTVAIGPEGGFTDQEIALATSAGWQRISLGPRILRVETAAVAIAAAVALGSGMSPS